MAVFLDHMIVPAKDNRKSAMLLARVLDVPCSEKASGPFVAVYVNDGLTLDFDQSEDRLPVLHYCFRMSEAEFDRVVERLRALGIPYRSTPHGASDGQVNTQHGGRIVYWSAPDGHVWEALTVSYARVPSETRAPGSSSA